MTSRFVPEQPFVPLGSHLEQSVANAVVTASYAPDFERCALLCETMDRYVGGYSRHYILVENRDVALFRRLESRNRTVIAEGDILPGWLKPIDDPLSGMKRRLWLSWKTAPLRGWHVQQLRRIAIARHVPDDALIYVDSDVAFVRPFDCGAFWQAGNLRLFRRENELVGKSGSEQEIWSRHAGEVLGIREPAISPHDYITTLIAWKRDAVLHMCERIQDITGRHFVSAIAARRQFSECMIYGRYVDEVLDGSGHFRSGNELCRVKWDGEAMTDTELHAFLSSMDAGQVAVGLQSFIGVDAARIRTLLDAQPA